MKQVLAAMAAMLGLALPAQAQQGMAVEVRGGAGVGNAAEAAADFRLQPRAAFGASVSYALRPAVAVYAGYSRDAFGCGGGFCAGRGMTFTSSGVEAGVRLSLPVAAAPWLRAGVVRHTLDFASSPPGGGPQAGSSGSGFGFEGGGGVEVRLGRSVSVTPGVRYLRHGAGGGVAMLIGDVGVRFSR